MKTDHISASAIGTGRVMEIILFLVGEMRRNKQIADIDLAKLSERGFTDSEVSTAFSWLFDKMAVTERQSVASNPRSSTFRIYHELEQAYLTSEARGYLTQLRELELLKDSEMELLIDRLWLLGAPGIGLDAVRDAAAEIIFDFSDASRMDSRMMLSLTDRVQ
jgi:uncharacterized protein Smg (DUF494 family)